MANSDARRMANAACCMTDGGWRNGSTPLLSLALPSSSPSPSTAEHVHFVPALLFLLLFFALFLLLLFGALAAHAPTRLASVGFSPRFPLAHFPFNPCTSLPSVLPSPYCHFHMQSACCRIFFFCFLCWHFLCSLAKSQPMSCGIFK